MTDITEPSAKPRFSDALGDTAPPCFLKRGRILHHCLIVPNEKVPRRTRRCLEAIARHRQAILMVVEDDTPGKLNPGPDGFDRSTIDWAIETADLMVVWSAGRDAPGAPEKIDDYLEAGRSVLMILTGSRSEAAWIALTAPHCSREREGLAVLPRPDGETVH